MPAPTKAPFFARIPLHPLLITAYPVLALLAQNQRQVEPWVAARPLIVSLLFGAIIFLAVSLALKNRQRAALLASLVLLLFFSYGHVYTLMRSVPALASTLGRHRFLAPLFLALLAGGVYLVLARIRALTAWTQILNLVSAVLLVLSLGQIGFQSLRQSSAALPTKPGALKVAQGVTKPDIYYIILDMHSRSDVIAQDTGFDNRPILEQLKSLGFFVADCSRSNYPGTEMSLSSSLNMTYLDQFAANFAPGSSGEQMLPSLIRGGTVRRQLEAVGYRTVAFETGFYWSQWMDASVYLAPTQSNRFLAQFRPFESMFIKSTAGVILVDGLSRGQSGGPGGVDFPFSDHIQRERFLLEKLPTLASLSGPKLVFAHILIPHNPQIFLANGDIQEDIAYYSDGDRPVNDEHFRQGYRQQVQFIDTQIVAIVKRLLAESRTPPVIIVQGDHGANEPNRHAILNAYYLPGGSQSLYAKITPVNSFRVVFNRLFNAGLPLLPDQSYNYNSKQGFVPVPEAMPGCK